MATKSTRFKYTKISKAICLLLATLLFSLGTWCAVELGIGEAEAVAEMFRQAGLAEVTIRKDLYGVERMVGAKRRSENDV